MNHGQGTCATGSLYLQHTYVRRRTQHTSTTCSKLPGASRNWVPVNMSLARPRSNNSCEACVPSACKNGCPRPALSNESIVPGLIIQPYSHIKAGSDEIGGSLTNPGCLTCKPCTSACFRLISFDDMLCQALQNFVQNDHVVSHSEKPRA